jgi:hypothetical protein
MVRGWKLNLGSLAVLPVFSVPYPVPRFYVFAGSSGPRTLPTGLDPLLCVSSFRTVCLFARRYLIFPYKWIMPFMQRSLCCKECGFF